MNPYQIQRITVSLPNLSNYIIVVVKSDKNIYKIL